MPKELFHFLSGAIIMLVLAVPSAVQAADASSAGQKQNMAMALHSSAFEANSDMPARFSCQGKGVSPPLAWSGVPANAKSLALIVDDPDAPSGTWVHWVVFNLPPSSSGLDENSGTNGLPEGAGTGMNSWKDKGYGGACPPSGRHRYVFKLYALDTQLPAKDYDRQAMLEAMQGHVLARAIFVATYRKQ